MKRATSRKKNRNTKAKWNLIAQDVLMAQLIEKQDGGDEFWTDDWDGYPANRTRLLKIAPGAYTTKPFVHEYWEEVYLISGDLTVGNDEKGEGGTSYAPNTYASRPPGAYHGPFKSKNGCVLFEIHYFDPV